MHLECISYCIMNAIELEMDLLKQLPEATLKVLRERAVREAKPLITVVTEVLNETAAEMLKKKAA